MSGISFAGRIGFGGELLLEAAVGFGRGWTCIMGPSGSGKTTLLRVMAGLPVAASVEAVIERPVRIGWMAQGDLLQPNISVAGNVGLIGRLAGRPVDGGRIDRALDQVGLSGFGRRMPDALSGGQRQRVALARTLIGDAELVALDEPFAALDPATRRQMQDLSRGVLAGRTVLMVTHDLAEALRLADRLLVVAGRGLAEVELPPAGIARSAGSAEGAACRARVLSLMEAA